ncbi:MAG: MFS transporter, partial [Candidatus Nanopelagicales bacterium]
PESPRWEVTHGRHESAARTIDAMEQCCREKSVSLEGQLASDPDENPDHFYRRLTILIAMWFLWYIGNYAFLGDGAQLLADNGTAIGGSIALLAIGAIGYPLGALAALQTVDRFERRVVILAASIAWLIAMGAVGSFAGDAIIAIGCLLASMSLGCFLQVAYTYTAESFPTKIRATGFALSDGIGHAGGAVGVLLLPVLVTHWSFGAGFVAIGITGLAAGLIALLGPKATQRRLEHISAV